MLFRVNLFEKGHLISTEVTDHCRLAIVQDYAVKAVEAGRADAAEVRRLNGSIMFRHPTVA